MIKRYPWDNFPPIWIHANESSVKQHPAYRAAKSGDPDAAYQLVNAQLNSTTIGQLATRFATHKPVLVSAHAVEGSGVNAIPEALADMLAQQLDWMADTAIIQTNIVGHTGADGFSRLARQAAFDGDIITGCSYLLVDDFIGQGGTLANLRAHIIQGGGTVLGATVLTGKPHSANITLTLSTLEQLRQKHGNILEHWWQQRFGFGLNCLTESEARYLLNTPNVDRIRNQIIAASQARDCPADQ
ncbi:phosphoribosyltransferase [Thiothrix subterranea]|uniref:Phosphoribosyltransferase n=1 Tax=Thiothrix subterranea TaxID=2735563 RepID=A0AA51R658_9GAMM|nr:phosphoribosyltransferase [Thiothrix subterranea]WML88565.1 phosphoribosyltransferase [Thiothrix subterranea]